MDLHKVVVTANDKIMPETHVIEVASPLLGQSSKAGQFVHIRCSPMWDPLLRRPMSIYRIRPEGVSIMVRAVGDGSEIIAHSAVGTEIDILGPLGRPFTIGPSARRLAMVGGGYGVAPLVALAVDALKRGCEVALLVGAS